MLNRHVIDLRALGPDWRLHEDLEDSFDLWGHVAARKAQANAHGYFTTCPATIKAMPVVNGVTRP